jgi:short-subunit dehydrogenase
MPNHKDKRIALIVGATGTLGKAIINNLISKNIQLILVAKNIDKLENLYNDIIDSSFLKPLIIPLDLNHGRSIDKLGGKVFEKYKKLDILINCSSFYPKLSPINHILPKDFSKIININITASWQLIRSFDPLLRFSKYGRAYFFICKQKIYQEPYFSTYALSSISIESLIKSWQKEIKKTNIIASTYDPGPIISKLRSSAFPGESIKNINTAKNAATSFINLLEESYES